MNVLTANIQREWLARILAGNKPIEYRDATEYWFNRLFRAGPPPFHLRLINGMKPDSPEATVLVERVDTDVFGGTIRLHLGPIVSTERCDQAWQNEFPPIPPDPPFDPTTIEPSSVKPTKITIQATADLVTQLASSGIHTFRIPVNVALHNRLARQAAAPFYIAVTADGRVVNVVLYDLYWDPFQDEGVFSVLSDAERFRPAALLPKSAQEPKASSSSTTQHDSVAPPLLVATPPAASGSPGELSLEQRFQRLHALRAADLITEEEYQFKRKAIIDQL